MTQARESARGVVHKSERADACGGIPHPHACAPAVGGGILHSGKQHGFLHAVPHIDHLGGRARQSLQRRRHILICFGVPPRDGGNNVAHAQAGRFGRILIPRGRVNIAEAHYHRAVGEHFDAEGRTAHLYHTPLHHLRAHGLYRHDSRDGKIRVIGRAPRKARHLACGCGRGRAHERHARNGNVPARRHKKGVGQKRADVQCEDKYDHHASGRDKAAPFDKFFQSGSLPCARGPANALPPLYAQCSVFVSIRTETGK